MPRLPKADGVGMSMQGLAGAGSQASGTGQLQGEAGSQEQVLGVK